MRVNVRALLLSVVIAVFVSPVWAQAKVEIMGAEFGIFYAKEDEKSSFEATKIVPKKTGQRYGWVIFLRTKERRVSVREEYLLPNDGTTSEPLPEGVIEYRPEKRVQVSQRQLVPVYGRIFGEWEVGEQEPAGRRTLQVIVEDQVAATFEFDVR